MTLRILGLDLSLTSTGIADAGGTRALTVPAPDGWPRVDAIARHIVTAARDVDVVVLEGAAFAKNLAYARSITELTGVVKYWLWREGIPLTLVAPLTLKKFATGVGKGGKDRVLIAAGRDPEFKGSTSDEADAYFLRRMGVLAYSGEPEVLDPLPQYQREALRKVLWPVLQERAA